MNLKSSNKVDTNRWELEIEVNAEDFGKAVNKVYQRQSKKITIPGFRKGKAPKAFIEKYYGESIFYDDAINDIYPDVVEEAIKEAGLDVIEDKVDFDLIEANKNGLKFKTTFTVKPEVSIKGYKGIEVKQKSSEVTDEDLKKEIKSVQDRNARIVEVSDRAVREGDIVVIDFDGYIDGVAFDGGKALNHSLTIGKKQFIDGFEDQIIGHNTNDEFDVNVTFPKEYHSKDLAEKEAVFKVKIHEIKAKELPEFDDEFVKDISEFDTVSQYEENLKRELLEKKEREVKKYYDDELLAKLGELIEADIPTAMFENAIKQRMRDFAYKLQSQGLDVQTYIKYTGLTQKDFSESFRPSAELQVKTDLALEKIAALEEIKPSETEIDDNYKELVEQYKIDEQEMKKRIPVQEIEKEISVKKAFDVVRDNMIIVD